MPRPIRNIQSYISNGTLSDLIAAHLYATTLVNDNEEVLELVLGEPDSSGIRPINFTIIQNKEPELIIHS